MAEEIMVIPFYGQGHILPCIELSNHLARRNFKITVVLPSNLASSITTVDHHPLIQIAEILQLPPPGNTAGKLQPPSLETHQMDDPFCQLLSQRTAATDPPPPVCLIVDVMMSWMLDACRKSGIPTISFFTSGACSAAMEFAVWKLQPENPKPGEILTLPGLPESVSLTFSDLANNEPPPPGPPPHHLGFGGGGHQFQPPPPHHHEGARNRHGRPPPWVAETDGSVALLLNSCSDLERPFLDYLSKETKKPVWGVGPLLPSQYWGSADSVVHDGQVRAKKKSNVTEEQVQDWLDSKPHGSVVYVCFGTEVGPTTAELAELACGLEESNRPFIWVLQSGAGRPGPPGPPTGHGVSGGPTGPPPGHGNSGGPPGSHGCDFVVPDGFESRVEGKGLVIRGWAPQLLILSHPSTAGFVCHCGWNSILEALGRGVPLLAWPIRGDQHYNAKLVVSHLEVGLMLRASDGTVTKNEIVDGIEKLIGGAELRERAGYVRSIFAVGFPASSSASLDAFRDFTHSLQLK